MRTAPALLAAAIAITAATGCKPRTTNTTTPTSNSAATPSATARHALAALPVRPEDTGAHYDRDTWGGWARHPGACTTRTVVLQRHGTNVTTSTGCRITGGRWTSPYDRMVIRDPRKLDIDHRVPVAEAVRSGARGWTTAQRSRFYNDLNNLLAVSATSNGSKSDSDPGRWRPANRDEWCGYAAAYIATKTRYGLSVDRVERDGLAALLAACR